MFRCKVDICGQVIANLENIINLEILPYLLHFSEVLKRMFIIKHLWGNLCNRLLQLNAAIVRGLTCCKIIARHLALRKIWSTKFHLGEVNHIQPVAYELRNELSYHPLHTVNLLLIDIQFE